MKARLLSTYTNCIQRRYILKDEVEKNVDKCILFPNFLSYLQEFVAFTINLAGYQKSKKLLRDLRIHVDLAF